MSAATMIGPYRVLGVLGEGAQHTVFAAVDPRSGAAVAVRVARSAGTGREGEFAFGAQLRQAIRHPGIVAVLDHGRTEDNRGYLVMERIFGGTLAARLAAGPLRTAECVALGIALAEALAHLHRAGLVHGDLSPANVMLREGDPRRPCLLDLRAPSGVDDEALAGTAAYLSPARARGDDAGPADDLWALNALLFHGLFGRAPFEGDSVAAILYRVLNDTPLEVREPAGEPTSLGAVVGVGLRRAEAQRWASAEALIAALRGVSGHEPLAASGRQEAAVPQADEVGLLTALVAREVSSPERAEALLSRAGARVTRLADAGVVGIFGERALRGDESVRAVAVGLTLSLEARAVAVAMGRCERHGSITEDRELIQRAHDLAATQGLCVDEATADLLGHGWQLVRAAGRARVLGRHAQPSRVIEAGPFVGREASREALRRSLDEAPVMPAGACVVLVGARGLGRTRTLEVAVAEARSREGVQVLRALTEDGLVSLGALRTALRTVDPGGADRFVPSPGAELAQSFADEAVAALGDALRGLARSAPTVLVIDDADRLDEASRAALHALFRRRDAPRIALWMSASIEAGAAVAAIHPASEVHPLAPFSPQEAERYLRETVGAVDPAIVARAAGSPAFLAALVRLRTADGTALPTDLEAAVRAAIDGLGPAARELLKRVSVFGRAATRAAITAMGGAWGAADELVQGGIATLAAEGADACLVVRSELVGEVARGLWTGPALRAQHARAAAWLGARPEADPAVVAEHLARAGEPEAAGEWWVRAAERSASLGLVAQTRSFAERVAAYVREPALRWRALAALDNTLQQSGDRGQQRAGLEALATLVDALEPVARCELHWRWCHHARMVGDAALAEEHGARARAFDPRSCRWAVAARVELALLFAEQGRFAEAGAVAAEAAQGVGEDDPWLAARALHARAYVAVESGVELDRGAEAYRRAAALYRRSLDRRREAIARVNLGVALIQQGRFGEALDAYGRGLEAAERAGNARAAAVALEGTGSVLRCLGEFDDAVTRLRAALAQAEELGHVRLAEAALAELGYVALARGDRALATSTHDRLAPLASATVAPVGHRLARQLGQTFPSWRSRCEEILGRDDSPPLLRIEAAAALRPEGEAWARIFDAAVQAYVEAARDPLGRALRRAGLQRRFELA